MRRSRACRRNFSIPSTKFPPRTSKSSLRPTDRPRKSPRWKRGSAPALRADSSRIFSRPTSKRKSPFSRARHWNANAPCPGRRARISGEGFRPRCPNAGRQTHQGIIREQTARRAHFFGARQARAVRIGERKRYESKKSRPTSSFPVCADIININAKIFGAKEKKADLVKASQICAYLMCEMLSLPLISIGNVMGGRDHTTIMYSRDKIEAAHSAERKNRQRSGRHQEYRPETIIMEEFIEYTADAVVVGAGHAGCEAALALARTGMNTVMLTLNLGQHWFHALYPPSAARRRGNHLAEIDALGGEMGRNADKTALQIRMLNVGKGAAVQSLRAQSDKNAYHREMKKTLEHTKNLRILQGEAAEILVENGVCKGVKTTYGGIILCRAVCSGFISMRRRLRAAKSKNPVPTVLPPPPRSQRISSKWGFSVRRFVRARPRGWTAAPSIIPHAKLGGRRGNLSLFLSLLPSAEKQTPLLSHVHQSKDAQNHSRKISTLYNGTIQSTGPRYCPSIETKVVRFKDKERHQIFLEPEGADTSEVYRACPRPCPTTCREKCTRRTIAGLEQRTSCATAMPHPDDALRYAGRPAHARIQSTGNLYGEK